MTTLDDISYHDATVLSFVKQGHEQIALELKCAGDEGTTARIQFLGVHGVSLDGALAEEFCWRE